MGRFILGSYFRKQWAQSFTALTVVSPCTEVHEILAAVLLQMLQHHLQCCSFLPKDMKWIEEKQALYRRNQELVEKVFNDYVCIIQIAFVS